MALPLESVPNLSEGRDEAVLDALREAMSAPARLLDIHVDRDHHRSVYTLVGSGEELVETLAVGIARAAELIDLREHQGAHPRVGAADVVPLVPLAPSDEPAARDAALALADRVAAELELPVFFYGRLTRDRREPAFFRRGGPEELQRRVDSGELAPDRGPKKLHPTAGAVVLGVRRPLIAFNINLRTDDLAVAIKIATLIRESSGGMPAVQAMGVLLENRGMPAMAQVSTNLVDWERTGIAAVVREVRRLAREAGTEIDHCELIGLAPTGALLEVAADALGLRDFSVEQALELRLARDR